MYLSFSYFCWEEIKHELLFPSCTNLIISAWKDISASQCSHESQRQNNSYYLKMEEIRYESHDFTFRKYTQYFQGFKLSNMKRQNVEPHLKKFCLKPCSSIYFQIHIGKALVLSWQIIFLAKKENEYWNCICPTVWRINMKKSAIF